MAVFNSRLTVALHVLCLLAHQRGETLTSGFIAGSVNTNPVVIRRVLAALRRAGLVNSRPGVSGGWTLSRSPSDITVAEVYRLFEPDLLFALHNNPPNPRCAVGKGIQRSLVMRYDSARAALERSFEEATVADLLRDALSEGE